MSGEESGMVSIRLRGMPKVEKVFGQEMGVCVNNFAIENFVTNN